MHRSSLGDTSQPLSSAAGGSSSYPAGICQGVEVDLAPFPVIVSPVPQDISGPDAGGECDVGTVRDSDRYVSQLLGARARHLPWVRTIGKTTQTITTAIQNAMKYRGFVLSHQAS